MAVAPSNESSRYLDEIPPQWLGSREVEAEVKDGTYPIARQWWRWNSGERSKWVMSGWDKSWELGRNLGSEKQ